MDKLNDIIIEHLGVSVFIMAAAVGALLFLAWWARGVRDRVRRIDGLPCDERGAKLRSAETRIAQMEERPCDVHRRKLDDHAQIITRLDTTIELLKSLLYTPKGDAGAQPFTQSQSPLSITPAGRDMMARTGMQAMFDERWAVMADFITAKAHSLNPYDIQEMLIEQCVVHPEKFLTPAQIDLLKLDAYNTGNVLASYMKVLAVLARDRYFAEHGINTADVDAYDPKNMK